MVQEQLPRDWQEPLLAAMVAGGATVGGMALPPLLHISGHTGAEFVGLAILIVGPVVFIVVGLVAMLIFRVGRVRIHFVVLAAVTAVVTAALAFAPSVIGGLASVLVTSNGALLAAGTVFIGLVLAIPIHRHRRAAREAALTEASATGSPVRSLRFCLGVVVLLAGLAAWIPAIVAPIALSFGFFDGPPSGSFISGLLGWAIVGAIPSALVAAWAVAVVVLVDQLVAPRFVRALSVGAPAAVTLMSMPLILEGGIEEGGAAAVWALASAIAAAVVLFFCERRGSMPRQPVMP
ncbi:hypothetical protein ASE14_08710 [Agromyces sp. Root81]|uniref:hypothetical protein n=1 Tax=Agromyces sp. Root81 TaxID=1736601 RepID=UPI0006FF69C4|nr:hypothetical protein [Agromyces sp. Root81]KRC61021.1 hypothetical protein ASE14_08710 [Agromyces sp. Root81]